MKVKVNDVQRMFLSSLPQLWIEEADAGASDRPSFTVCKAVADVSLGRLHKRLLAKTDYRASWDFRRLKMYQAGSDSPFSQHRVSGACFI